MLHPGTRQAPGPGRKASGKAGARAICGPQKREARHYPRPRPRLAASCPPPAPRPRSDRISIEAKKPRPGLRLPPAGLLLPPAGLRLPPAGLLLPPAGLLLPPAGLRLPPSSPWREAGREGAPRIRHWRRSPLGTSEAIKRTGPAKVPPPRLPRPLRLHRGTVARGRAGHLRAAFGHPSGASFRAESVDRGHRPSDTCWSPTRGEPPVRPPGPAARAPAATCARARPVSPPLGAPGCPRPRPAGARRP